MNRRRVKAETAKESALHGPTAAADLDHLAMVAGRMAFPVVITEVDGRVRWINEAFTQVTGFEPWDVHDRTEHEYFLVPESDRAAIALVAKARVRGVGFRVEIVGRRKDDRRIWFDIDSQPVFDEAGSIIGYFAVYVDVTERRETEAKLLAQEEKFRDFAEAVSDWYWETDASHRIVQMNSRVDFPISASRSHGRCRWEIASDRHDHQKWAAHRALLDARAPFRDFRYEAIDDDGNLRIISTSGKPVFTTDGRFLGYRGVSSDVTERERTTWTMDQLVRALNATDERVFLFDANERLVFVNEQTSYRRPGFEPATLVGLTAAELFDRLDEIMFEEGVIAARGDHSRMRLERFRNPSGAFEVPYICGMTLLLQDYRVPDDGTICLVTDITESKARERALQDARVRADAANRAKSAFLAHMNHELRTPLNAIIGFADLIATGGDRYDRDLVARYVGYIAAAGRDLRDIVEDVLEFASIENGEFRVEPQPVAVRAVLAKTLRQMRDWTKCRNLRIACSVERPGPVMLIDPGATIRALEILVRETCRYAEAGDVVDIGVRHEKQRVMLEIGGIEPASKFAENGWDFEPFHGSRDPGVKDDLSHGVGLSLATARSLVVLQGGTIRAHVDAPRACSVIVAFPCSEPSESTPGK